MRMSTSEAKVKSFLSRAAKHLQEMILKALSKLGDECVVRVRDRSERESWINQTGNLRSSIGFGVYEQGKKFMTSTMSTVLNGKEGTAAGKKMIDDLAKEYANVYALVVIAAMEYASYVEAVESKDVLASTRIWAMGVVEKRINTAVKYAIEEINKWEL